MGGIVNLFRSLYQKRPVSVGVGYQMYLHNRSLWAMQRFAFDKPHLYLILPNKTTSVALMPLRNLTSFTSHSRSFDTRK